MTSAPSALVTAPPVNTALPLITGTSQDFARSQWSLSAADMTALKGIRPAVLRSGHVTVNGYSSDDQHEPAVLWLARARAKTVAQFLLAGKTAPPGMTVAGHYGRYIASNRTAAGRVANRRVHVAYTVTQYR